MFSTRVPGSGNTTNLNLVRKRRRRASTPPVAGRRRRPSLEALETRQLLSTYYVTNTNDSNAGSLRQAIVDANHDEVVKGGMSPDDIVFNIPASTAPLQNVPVPGFDPGTQTWTITLQSPLPAIINTVSIDGYTEAPVGVPYRYSSISSAAQSISISGTPTGGFFTLTTASPLPAGITGQIAWNAGSGVVQAALGAIVGSANVTVTGGPAPSAPLTITFQNQYAEETIQPLVATSNLTGGTTPAISVSTIDPGGTVVPNTQLTYIQNIPNGVDATDGNNAQQRVIIDGSQFPAASAGTGFVLDASDSLLRGLIIDGFSVGVSVSALDTLGNPVVGDLIQGNSIGAYFLYPVDLSTGSPLTAPDNVEFVSAGNSQQGVILNSSNTTVGGSIPQENNIICGNGAQGILVVPGASGNTILGNQIGMAGPSINGLYSQDGNGAQGVLIESTGSLNDPLNIVYSSSNFVGSATGGNLISANAGAGVELDGVGAIRNLLQGNYIGVAPGGGYKFGTGDPGNLGDGVLIQDGSQNQIGGTSAALGNTIDSNHGAGIYLTGLATGNVAANNMIGVTAGGSQVLGNWAEGVAVYAPSNTIGPGNVISQNLLGIGIYTPLPLDYPPGTPSDTLVVDNLIGTDSTGQQGLGNAKEGVRIDNSADNTIQGNASGSQVISGNQVGVALIGAQATGNLVEGDFIGSDNTGFKDLGNKNQGVLISGAINNTIGGSLASGQNLISANHWGIQVDGAGATGNLVQRNYIGTDITGTARLGNEVYGIVFSNSASLNTIGGATAGLGNRIAFQVSTGVLVESGTGDSILSNSIFSNGRLGIDLVAPGDPPSGVTPNPTPPNPVRSGPNNLQAYPVLTSVTSNGTLTHILGTLYSQQNTTFLIQFFTSPTADASGYGEGETFLGSTQLATDQNGNATIDLPFAVAFPPGGVLAATATNMTTGDTSEFTQAVSESPALQFLSGIYTASESSGSAVITVWRSLSTGTSSVNFATSDGTAKAGTDYLSAAGTLVFNPGDTTKTFTITLLDPHVVGGVKTVNLSLSNPVGGLIDFQPTSVLQISEDDSGVSGTFTVTNTLDTGPGSLRQAILNANAAPGLNSIVFDIPASTDPLLDVPVPGFDPVNQTWTITVDSPLPVISDSVAIDGFTQAESGVPFRYPNAISSAAQQVNLSGVVTSGFFTLGTSSPLPIGSTGPIDFNASAQQLQAALDAIPGMAGNILVTGGSPFWTVTFQGQFAGQTIPDLTANANGLIGLNPTVSVQTATVGGLPTADPVLISSTPNSTMALQGNNAHPLVIINGSQTADATGLVLNAPNSLLRGLIIDGFAVGVSIPQPTDAGDSIQGNFIGKYFVYPVDPNSGSAVTGVGSIVLAGVGNTEQGIVLDSDNTTVGGTNPQENNVIAGNGLQAVLLQADATGNVVEGNQIGIIGPSSNGLYYQVGNGAEGVLVYGSSNLIGVPGAGNVISANGLAGVRISGATATRTIVAANLIGLAPGGGYRFGTSTPGNGADGVWIEDSALNQIGGPSASWANVISSNSGNGVDITGVTSQGNTVSSNMIGLTADGKAVKGNVLDGVVVFSPQNTIGPGNVISGNLRGVDVSGASATGNLIAGNLIGTDASGAIDMGNAYEGVLIQDATGNVVQGDSKGSQVISGNLVGVAITGATAASNLVAGNFIGSDKTGLNALPNSQEGIKILGAVGNTIGGTTGSALNLVSANHWGIRIDGASATGNLIEGNYIGTDITGLAALGNEVNGVIISTNASNNTVGGQTADLGNKIAFNAQAGVSVWSGTGDSILSNSIWANGRLGIDLVAPGDPPSGVTPNPVPPNPPVRTGPNNLQAYPVLTYVTSNGTLTHIHGTLYSQPGTTFLIQFFTNPAADPSGHGQGQFRFGSIQVTTDATGNVVDATGNGGFDATLTTPFTAGMWLSATATNLSTGDTSEFAQDISQSPAMEFSAATYTVNETDGSALITVVRTMSQGTSTVNYATVPGGTAVPIIDYTSVSDTLTFNPGVTTQTFVVPINDSAQSQNITKTVFLALTTETGGYADFQTSAVLNIIDHAQGSSRVFWVTNTQDSGLGSLRQAILNANARPGPDDIEFAIPASLDPNLNVPVSGFDPETQTWTINLLTALPTITDQVIIDGYSQGELPIPYRYPSAFTETQIVTVTGTPTGGSFTLSAQSPLPVLTTDDLPYNATAADVGLQLVQILGMNNVTVSGGPANVAPLTITFQGDYQGQTVPALVPTSKLTGGVDPTVGVTTSSLLGATIPISSSTNTIAGTDGNNVHIPVIVDGSQIPGGAPGFVINATDSILRGLIIDGFTIGVSVPSPADVGNLIQGNCIGGYYLYPVDTTTGAPIPAPDSEILAGLGNTQQGIYIDGENTTVGGIDPQDSNVIVGNGQQGILIDVDADGNVVEGNEIGIIGPSENGLYNQVGNQGVGVLVYGSSNAIGGPGGGSGNLISANQQGGVQIVGPTATRNIVAANYIGIGPGGGYALGTGDPGNQGDGVQIENSTQNQVGGPSSTWANVISSNSGAGVEIDGITSTLNTVANNLIGLTADGKAVKGNYADGVVVYSPQTTIGPGNVISGNLRGVRISGPDATDVVVRDNLIGTDITGTFDLGNALEGIRIEDATDAQILGNAKGSQVISGNYQGIVITGATATRNLVQGNLIGSDETGLNAIPNAYEGVAILGAPGNTIGGTTAAAQNLISANHWGVRLDGADAVDNLVQGNLIGPDITGTAPLGDEVNGVIVSSGASNNMIGGTVSGAGNTIAFNVLAGVSVESGTGDSILTNSIYSNGHLGIDLVAPGDPPSGVTPNEPGVRVGPNDLQNYPILTTAIGGGTSSSIQGTLNSLASTSFLIQFFTSLVSDPSGYGQGQTWIGSITVTTDASGNVPITFAPLSSLAASIWVTATATNTSTGDTSEFSNAVSAVPVSEQFLTASMSVDVSAGSALVHVERSGNPDAIVAVNYATSNGTAVAGQDYSAASGTLIFLAGEIDQTFLVTILPNPSQAASSVTVNLALSQPTGGSTLGSPSTEVLTINNNLPPILQFSSSSYATYTGSSSSIVSVTRGGGSRGTTVQVNYATAGGSAVAGVDYTAVSGTLTFQANQTMATFTVPILHGGNATVTKTVGLVLSTPTGGGQLGPISTATLTILAASPVNPTGPPLLITGEQLVLGPAGITAVLFSFNQPLNPSRVPDLGNFGYFVDVAGANGVFRTSGDTYIPLSAAQYNAATSTVTVIPSTPLPPNRFERITIDGLANPLLNRGLIDTSGTLLTGQTNGVPGSPYFATFAVGSSLSYTDDLGKIVQLRLTGGGAIEEFRTFPGDPQSVVLLGAVPGKSVLTFQANMAGGRTTYMPPIQGAAGVRFRYKSPARVFRTTPLPLIVRAPRGKTAAVKRPK